MLNSGNYHAHHVHLVQSLIIKIVELGTPLFVGPHDTFLALCLPALVMQASSLRLSPWRVDGEVGAGSRTSPEKLVLGFLIPVWVITLIQEFSVHF